MRTIKQVRHGRCAGGQETRGGTCDARAARCSASGHQCVGDGRALLGGYDRGESLGPGPVEISCREVSSGYILLSSGAHGQLSYFEPM